MRAAVNRKLGMFVILGAAVVLLSGVIAGIAFAQDGEGDEAERGPGFAARVAAHLGVTEEQLRDAIEAARLDMVDEAAAKGRISPEQAERLRQRIEEGLPGPLAGLRHLLRDVVDAVSDTLDMTPREILQELRDGQSLAGITEAQGVARDELKDVILTEVQENLAQAVAQGKLTQERADSIMARLNEKVDKVLDWERCEGFFGRGPGPHHWGVPFPFQRWR